MIDAEYLVFAREAKEFGIQTARGLQVVTERLFDDDALPAFSSAFFLQQSGFVNLFGVLAELAGESGEIKKYIIAQRFVPETSDLLFELLVSLGLGDVTLAIEKAFGKFLPDRFVNRFGAGELVQGLS